MRGAEKFLSVADATIPRRRNRWKSMAFRSRRSSDRERAQEERCPSVLRLGLRLARQAGGAVGPVFAAAGEGFVETRRDSVETVLGVADMG